MVVAESIFNEINDICEQIIQIKNGDHRAGDLGQRRQLFGSSALCVKQPTSVQRGRRLVRLNAQFPEMVGRKRIGLGTLNGDHAQGFIGHNQGSENR